MISRLSTHRTGGKDSLLAPEDREVTHLGAVVLKLPNAVIL